MKDFIKHNFVATKKAFNINKGHGNNAFVTTKENCYLLFKRQIMTFILDSINISWLNKTNHVHTLVYRTKSTIKSFTTII